MSKLKKILIELSGFAAKDFFASYKNFKVVVHHDGKKAPVAFIPESAAMNWIDSTVANKNVRDALEEFVAELE